MCARIGKYMDYNEIDIEFDNYFKLNDIPNNVFVKMLDNV